MNASISLLDERAYRHVASPAIKWMVTLLSAVPCNEVSDGQKGASRSLLELHGLGSEVWQGVDAVDYVRSLRDEWDR